VNKKLLFVFIILVFVQGACSFGTIVPNTVVGSGKVISETRNVSGFSSVELQGSANMEVTFGNAESVVITADDNILPLIETNVQTGQLIIRDKAKTNINPSTPVRVNVTIQALKGVTLSGSGKINVSQMAGDSLVINLTGSGSITVTGTVTAVNASLPGSGNIYCGGLHAKTAKVKLDGSGDIEIYASQSLDAGILGSGSILYSGNPAQVSKSIVGSGNITPQN
jgi:hypothetical protein